MTKNSLAPALDELARANERAVTAFCEAMNVSNRILRELSVQMLKDSQINVEYMNAEECAQFLRINLAHLYKLTHKHQIPYSKAGRILRFNKAEIVSWMQQYRVKTDAELLEG